MSAGAAFADMRRGAGLTVGDVAARAGVPADVVAAFEGGGNIDPAAYRRLVVALAAGVTR